MYNKLNLAITKIASKVTIRPELASVAFFGDKTVTTDSYRLIEVSAPGERLEEPVLLNAKHLKSNFKPAVGEHYSLEQIMTRSGAKPVIGTFPKYEEIMNPAVARTDDLKVKINGKLLAELVELASQTNKFSVVELSIPLTQGLPILVSSQGSGKDLIQQKVRGLIMPINK